MSNRDVSSRTQPESHEAWVGSTTKTLAEGKDCTQKLRSMLEEFEQREKDKIAREAAERRRKALLAAQAEERRLREIEEQRQLAFKKSQADALGAQQALVKQGKLDEAEAIKEATRRFLEESRREREAKEKHKQLEDLRVYTKKILGAILACKKTSSMLFSLLKVCEKRMEMRDDMPVQERFKDEVHAALEEQHALLILSRQKLHRFCLQAHEIKDEMKRVMVLIATDRSRENVVRRMEKTLSLPSLHAQSLTSVLTVPEVEPLSELLEKSRGEIKRAHAVILISEKMIKDTNDACDAAEAKVNANLDLRKADTDALRKHIAEHRKEVEAMISDADARISGSIGVAEEHELQKAEEIARQCQDIKSRLDDDYRNKMSALKIDSSCRTLTKVRAGGHRDSKARNSSG